MSVSETLGELNCSSSEDNSPNSQPATGQQKTFGRMTPYMTKHSMDWAA